MQNYYQNGYYIAKALIPPTRVNEILETANRLISYQLQNPRPFEDATTLFDNLKQLLAKDINSYLGAVRLTAKLVSTLQLVIHPKILKIVKQLGLEIPTKPTTPILHIASDQLTIPDGYQGFRPHQDWTSLQGSLDSLVVWIPLTQVTEDSYPLQVIPESHKKGLLATKDNSSEIIQSLPEKDFVSVLVEPGDVVFMSSWTIHRTGSGKKNEFRAAVSTRYENAAERTFIDRNYPSGYKRSVERGLITPGFPSIKQVRDTFVDFPSR